LIFLLDAHTAAVEMVQFDPLGDFIIVGARDGFVSVWEAATGTIELQEKWIEVIGNTIPSKANINTVLLNVNYNVIIEKGLSPISPIITSTPELLYDINIHKQFGTPVSRGDLIMTFHIL
jgi:WD40 repeat protein